MREIVVSIQGPAGFWLPMPLSALLRPLRVHGFDPLTWDTEPLYEGTLREIVDDLARRLTEATGYEK